MNLNVLIVDDDSSQGKALLEAVKRSGYNAEWATSPQQALTIAHHIEFHAIAVDCMLPAMSGVDLVEKIKPHLVEGADIFLMTGVFKDRAFIKEASEKTLCTHFFVKPFAIEQWLSHLEAALSKWHGPDQDASVDLYQGPMQNLEEWLKATPTFHALHLPMLLRRIQQSHLTGRLVLSHGSSIHFIKGNVCEVRNADSLSFFGLLAIEKGFVTPEEVEAVLQSEINKPIGQLLIEALALSPHAVNIVLGEQIALRLSQAVQDVNVDIHWFKDEVIPPEMASRIQLTPERLESLFLQWLPSKYDQNWLRTLYNQWGDLEGVNAEAHATPLNLFKALQLDQARLGRKRPQTLDYAAIHTKLERALETFRGANLFQILGVSEKTRSKEIARAFETLSKAFLIPKEDPTCPPETKAAAEKVKRILEHAHTTLVDDESRNAYIRELEYKKSEENMSLEPTYRAAIMELHSGHYNEAFNKFDGLIGKKAKFKDLRAYRIWAQVKRGIGGLSETDLFDQVPPEERFSATFMMARGMFFTARERHDKALPYFKNAAMLDPKLIIAAHAAENAQRAVREASEGVLVREVKSVIGSLLGKKKSNKKSA